MKTLLSLQEFEAIRDEGHWHELNRGELVVTPIPFSRHTMIVNNILHLLPSREEGRGLFLPRTGYLLSPDPQATVRAPDLSFLSRARVAQASPDEYFEGAPELAIEVVSSSDSAEDLRLKVKQYLAFGSQEVWVFYPKTRSVDVFKRGGSVTLSDADTLTTDLFPGWSARVADFFDFDY